MDFYQTKGGQQFYYGTMPRIAKALERIADVLEASSKKEEETSVEPQKEEDGIAPFYFTFGRGEEYPFQEGYIIIMASSKEKAEDRFRKEYGEEGKNYSFAFTQAEWDKISQRYRDMEPEMIWGTGINNLLTWDDIYSLADGAACGDPELVRKDNARENIRQWAIDNGLGDIERAENTEEEIDGLCRQFDFGFDEFGDLIKVKKR